MFPTTRCERTRYRYGARLKDNWWDNDGAEFVSPLQPTCERVFRFKLNGEIEAVDNRTQAITTIDVLGLNHRSLTEDRKRVIEEFIYGPTKDDPMSYAAAQRVRDAICDRDGNGRFYEFCIALRAALDEHVVALTKLRQRRRIRTEEQITLPSDDRHSESAFETSNRNASTRRMVTYQCRRRRFRP